MASRSGDALRQLAGSILGGKSDSKEVAQFCLDQGATIEDVLTKGVIGAWLDFATWYDRDPDGALKSWTECYNATNQVLRMLESEIRPPENPSFSAAVVTVRGEGHILMRDILSLLLKSRGVNVYTSRKGVVAEHLQEWLTDSSLRWIVISCSESALNAQVTDLINWAKARRPDIRVMAGGPQAENVGADLIVNDVSEFLRELGL